VTITWPMTSPAFTFWKRLTVNPAKPPVCSCSHVQERVPPDLPSRGGDVVFPQDADGEYDPKKTTGAEQTSSEHLEDVGQAE
jgi:hypothetical protein